MMDSVTSWLCALERGHPPSEYDLSTDVPVEEHVSLMGNLRNSQGLVTKYLSHMLNHLPLMLAKMDKSSPINIEAHPH